MARPLYPRPGTGLDSVLVATDLSPSGLDAVTRAAMLPLAPAARVTLLHVVPDQPVDPPARRARAAFARHRMERLRPLFRGRWRIPGAPPVQVQIEVAHGRPFVEIVRSARRLATELVVLGRHGAGGVRDLLIGSTAERVVGKCPTPVLIVNQEPRAPYRRPVFTTDLEAVSRRAIRFALPWLDPDVDQAPLVHAYTAYEGFVTLRATPAEQRRLRLAFRASSVRQLRQFLATVRTPHLRWQPRLRRGDPREVILAEAAHHHADLVVLGSHSRGRIARALLGSVAHRIVTAASCDVLVVRPPSLEVRLP